MFVSNFNARFSVLLASLFLAGVSASPTLAASSSGRIEFNRDIRPILSDNCFNCHGPDKGTRKAGLRLDLEAAARADLGGYFAIVPGQPGQSELFQRITTKDSSELMPPPKSEKKLSPEQIALLKRWIEQGAKWQPHWAYIPPQRPAPPAVKKNSWPLNPVDHFILARLEQEKLRPSSEADRRTLIRRLSFDLTGLPPSPEEVAAFVNDRDPQAYERLVDRWLTSPHYGERLAMHWLDLVRYADTVGYHGDQNVSIYPFRDYVIDSFNQNLPFDQFTREQLAGDLLPNATRAQKIASGYNRLNMMTAEGGAQDKEYLAKYAADRVRTTASVWLGATLGCAECHDHKFDPYTARDFYSFAAFFADLKEKGFYGRANATGEWGPRMQLPNAAQAAELARLNAIIDPLKKKLETQTPSLEAAQDRWEERLQQEIKAGRLAWQPQKLKSADSQNGATLEVQKDLSILAGGENPSNDVYTVVINTDREHLTGIRLEALRDPSLSDNKLSRGNGNFILTGFEVEVAGAENGLARPVKIAGANADFEQPKFPVSAAIDGKPNTGWAVNGHTAPANRQAVFTFASPIRGGPGTILVVRLKHESKQPHHVLGKFRLALISVDRPTLDKNGMPEAIAKILQSEPEKRSEKQRDELAAYHRSIALELDSTRARLAKPAKEKEALDKIIPTTLVSESTEPRVMRILARGNWMDDSGPVVQPAVPQFLAVSAGARSAAVPAASSRSVSLRGGTPPELAGEDAHATGQFAEQRLTRLDLAEWLVSPENPLTARVFVNRLWKLYFGHGLSKVLDDVGSQGEWPYHPELLDWLAVEFQESGWDIKHLVRLLVTSRTYRQSSLASSKLRERDPFNRLLARQSRFRLEAELIRDNALFVSGLLATTFGGPAAKPYQPAGYYAQLNFPKREYEADQDENQYRRGVYTHWQRTFLHPALLAFDAPNREECTAERTRSNTPLQALVLLNDPSFVEAARVLAARILDEGGADFEARLNWAFQRVLSRAPISKERKALLDLFQKHRAEYDRETESAQQLTGIGLWPVPDDLPAGELAAWTSVARVLLNLHETMARY